MLMPNDEDSVKTKCTKWLENCEISDNSSIISSNYASASSASHSRSIQEETEFFSCDKNVFLSDFFDSLEETSKTTDDITKRGTIFGNININKSRKIHVGNVTYITGPVIFNQNVSMNKKPLHTKMLLRDISNFVECFQREDNTFIVHLNQTVNVKSKSWKQIFLNCLYRFMEICMQLVDGA